MRTCYCRKCGTANMIKDGQKEYTCTGCSAVNRTPEAVAGNEQAAAADMGVYSYNPYEQTGSSDSGKKKKERKGRKTPLIIALSVLAVIIAAAAVLLLTPVKSPFPLKLRCNECGHIKYSEKYEVTYPKEGKVRTEWICGDCFDEHFEETD